MAEKLEKQTRKCRKKVKKKEKNIWPQLNVGTTVQCMEEHFLGEGVYRERQREREVRWQAQTTSL